MQLQAGPQDNQPTTAGTALSEQEREALIMRHAPLVRSIARRYAGRGMAHDDLLQTGYLGLIQAVDRYDPTRGVPLRAYAARTIEGEIMHLFRDRGWAVHVPRPLQELGRRVKAAREDLAHRLGRNPTVAELAKELDETPEDIEAAIDARRAYSAEPLLDGSSDENDQGAGEQALEVIDDGFDRALDREALRRAISVLDPRARRIVALRFLHDQTQSEIAEQLGISQMHVSRLLRRALAEMHSVLEPEAA
jgi:RNA polymerase sigma-B factor